MIVVMPRSMKNNDLGLEAEKLFLIFAQKAEK